MVMKQVQIAAMRAANADPDVIAADLAVHRRQAMRRIEHLAGGALSRLTTTIPGQDQIYAAKKEESAALLSRLAGDPWAVVDPGDYPMLRSCIGLDGDTLKACAEAVDERERRWRQAAADIDRARRTGLLAVREASDIEAIDAALAAIVFPV